MNETTTIGVRVPSSLEERVRRLSEDRPDGIKVTRSQVLRAALEIGLLQMEKAAKEAGGKSDEHK